MARRRESFGQWLRSLVLQIVILLAFALFMWNVGMPWATNAGADSVKHMQFGPTPSATVGPS